MSRRQLIGYVIERLIGVRADARNGCQADNDDQGQHHGVFHGGRAIFRCEETLHLQSKTLHFFLQILGRPPALFTSFDGLLPMRKGTFRARAAWLDRASHHDADSPNNGVASSIEPDLGPRLTMCDTCVRSVSPIRQPGFRPLVMIDPRLCVAALADGLPFRG